MASAFSKQAPKGVIAPYAECSDVRALNLSDVSLSENGDKLTIQYALSLSEWAIPRLGILPMKSSTIA